MTSISGNMRLKHFTTQRHARCAVRGPELHKSVSELWILLHGYGQLATDFLGSCSALDDGRRLLVAPEALSRFYNTSSEATARSHRDSAVGASWMTREERSFEIRDYLAWLQQAYEHFAAPLPPSTPVNVLGFSQGGATASRWVASGSVSANRLICWGSSIAPEIDLGDQSLIRRARTSIVIGDRDRSVSKDQIDAERRRLDAAGFDYEFVQFAGGHRMDDTALAEIA